MRAEKQLQSMAMSPATLVYVVLRKTMGEKLTRDLSSVAKDMISKIDLDHDGMLIKDEMR